MRCAAHVNLTLQTLNAMEHYALPRDRCPVCLFDRLARAEVRPFRVRIDKGRGAAIELTVLGASKDDALREAYSWATHPQWIAITHLELNDFKVF